MSSKFVKTIKENESAKLKELRMRKAVLMMKKLKGKVLPNNISMSEIVSEQKRMHKERKS
jgi:hypothetical protein